MDLAKFNGWLKESTNKRTLYILIGPPAVGKSTWIEKNIKGDKIIINRDDIILDHVFNKFGFSNKDLYTTPFPGEGVEVGQKDPLFPEYGEVIINSFGKKRFSRVEQALEELAEIYDSKVEDALSSNADSVVFDAMNSTRLQRERLLNLVSGRPEFKTVGVFFHFKGSERILVARAKARAESMAKKYPGFDRSIDPARHIKSMDSILYPDSEEKALYDDFVDYRQFNKDSLDEYKDWLHEEDTKPDFAILKSEGSVGPLYTLLDAKRLVNFAQNLVDDYQSGVRDPDITEDDLINKLIIISSVRIAEPTDSVVDHYGYCMGASQVKVSAVNSGLKGQRYGELLYSYVFGEHPEGLMPDREDVSPSAQKLWNRIATMAKVKTASDDQGTYNSFDDKDNPRTKTKEDDCVIHTDKSKETLNRAYVMQGLDPKKLISKGELAVSNAAEILQGLWEEDSIRYMIDRASMTLFDRAMGIQEGNKTWGPNKKSKKTLPSPYKKETSKNFPYTKDRTKGGVAATYKRRSKRIGGASLAPGEAFGPMEGKKR